MRNYPTVRPKIITLFTTCLADMFYPQVRHSTRSLLESLGYQVVVPEEQTCCGQPAFNSGKWAQARYVSQHFIEVFSSAECIVVPSGSCGAMVCVNMEHLFAGDLERQKQVHSIAERTFELVEFLTYVHNDPSLAGKLERQTVTYHYSCHQRELGLKNETTELLSQAKEVKVVPLEGFDECCGFGGTFSVRFPEVSGAMLDKKLNNINAAINAGAECVITNDLGCLMNMECASKKQGKNIRFRHVVELLAPKSNEEKK